MIKKIPNILCFVRIGLIPFMLLFLLINPTNTAFIVTSGVLFGIAMITDAFDGKIARKYDAVTNFGKFIDPIADKMLVISLLMAFIEIGQCSSVPVILVLAREFLVTGLRLSAAAKGKVVPANIWGKIKTVTQSVILAVSYVFLLISSISPIDFPLINVLVWILSAVTVLSSIPYIKECREYIKD